MNQRLHPLANPYFILSLSILLINDFYLKHAYHHWITGKLSDVVGLFVFAYFWSSIFPTLKKAVYILTFLAFVYWKSEYSQTFITFFSNIFYPVVRTVDMSDLLAVLVLPIAYSVKTEQWFIFKPERITIPISIITIFSFCATSVPAPHQNFDRPQYVLFKLIDIDNNDNYINEFQIFNIDSMTIVAVNSIETEQQPQLADDYYKSHILADLDLRILRATHGSRSDDLSSFKALRDNFKMIGPTSVTLNRDSVFEELNFSGTRLNGPYKRYSQEKELLIDGWYNNGVPDSVWNIRDVKRKTLTRQYFHDGELTAIEKIGNGTPVREDVRTRQDSIAKEFWILSVISLMLVGIIAKLFMNSTASRSLAVPMSTTVKICLTLFLPTFIFLTENLLSIIVQHYHSDMFGIIGEFWLTNIILMPILAVVIYGIKLRNRLDIVLYIVLFMLAMVWVKEYLFLKSIVV